MVSNNPTRLEEECEKIQKVKLKIAEKEGRKCSED